MMIKVNPLISSNEVVYDALIASVGFERRATGISEMLHVRSRMKVASIFTDNRVLSFEDNLGWFREKNFDLADVGDKSFADWFKGVMNRIRLLCGDNIPRVAVDISSASRYRIATIVYELSLFGKCRVDFLYMAAPYTPPPEWFAPNSHIGPVTSDFAGWTSEPEKPIAAIVGLGYEQDRALGAVEHVQASRVMLFYPQSPLGEYESEVMTANRGLLELVPASAWLPYQVMSPFDLFGNLESLCYGLSRQYALILFPFGPKIFSLVAMVVSRLYPSAAVWRVSPGSAQPPEQRDKSDLTCGLSVHFDL